MNSNKKVASAAKETLCDICVENSETSLVKDSAIPVLSSAEYGSFMSSQAFGKNISAEFELNRIRHAISSYVTSLGGYFEIPKGDIKYNSLNLEMINTIKTGYGTAYMGHMADCCNSENTSIEEIFTEYNGQSLSPFCCDFVVPIKDTDLEKMVRCWNESPAANGKVFREIIKKVNSLGGVLLSWA